MTGYTTTSLLLLNTGPYEMVNGCSSVCMSVYVCLYICVCVSVYVCVSDCVCVSVYIYIYINYYLQNTASIILMSLFCKMTYQPP